MPSLRQFGLVVSSFEDWCRGAGLDIKLTETMVYSATYHHAGAMDTLASREGELVAPDWKTSNGLYPEYAMQVAPCAKAMEEMAGQQVKEAWAVRFGKDSLGFEARKLADLDGAFNAFSAALFLCKATQGTLL